MTSTDLTDRYHVIDEASPHLGGNMVGGDPRCWFPDLWAWLCVRFGVRTMLDVGCGEGHAVEWFAGQGVEALGIDGLAWNVAEARKRGVAVFKGDLTLGPLGGWPVDLVWCCEVVEHIHPDYLDNLLDTLANGHVVAMTAAEPGQDGHHHVNCQPSEYWVEKMATRGYRPLVEETNYGRSLCGHGYFGMTGLIFGRAA